MKIVGIDAIPLDAELKAPFRFGRIVRTRSSNVLVRIDTDEGIVGAVFAGDGEAVASLTRRPGAAP